MKTPTQATGRILALLLLTACLGFAQSTVPPPDANSTSSKKKAEPVVLPVKNDSDASTDQVIELSPFTVTTSSSNVGYGAETTSSSSRIAQRYIDVPQTVNVVTSEFLKDAKLFDSQQAIKYVPNVERVNNNHDVAYQIRGLQTQGVYIDGFRTARGVGGHVFDMAFYDRLEVVKGPTSAGFGRGDPAGLINYVTKQPIRHKTATEVEATYGSDNTYRATIDINSNALDGRLTYRVNALYHEGDLPREHWHVKRAGLQLGFRYDLSENTNVTSQTLLVHGVSPGYVGAAYLTDKVLKDYLVKVLGPSGLYDEFPGLIDKHAEVAPDGGFRRQDLARTELILEHRFNEHVQTRQAVMAESANEEYKIWVGFPFVRRGSDGIYRQETHLWPGNSHPRSQRYQGDILLKYDGAGITNRTLVGWEAYHSDFRFKQIGLKTPLQQDIFHPNPIAPVFKQEDLTDCCEVHDEETGYGFFIQDQIGFLNDRVVLLGAWRKDYSDFKSTDILHGTPATGPGEVSNKGMPRVALTLRPVPWASIYGLYAEHKDPQQVTSRYVNLPTGDPRESERLFYNPSGTLKEVGVKMNLLNEKLTASIARFDMERQGTPQVVSHNITLPGGGTGIIFEQVITGPHLKGWEFEVFGQPTDRVTLYAAYGKNGGSQPAGEGREPVNNIYDSITAHAKIDFGDLKGNGFKVTAGGKYLFGDSYFGDKTYYGPSQYTVDGGASYSWRNGSRSVDLRVNNITDQLVYITGNGQWELRQWFVTYNAKF